MKPIFDEYRGKTADDLWYRHWRLQLLIIMCRLCDHHPELIQKKYRKEFTVSDAYFFSLEREYLRLCVKISKPNTLVRNTYPGITGYETPKKVKSGPMLDKPGVRMLLQRYGTSEAISEYPWA